MTITSLIVFFAILFFLVVIHELGHFVFAKWTKMRVDEFAFGFPPRLLSKKIGETLYSFNLIPLGGYVKIFGENGLTEEEKDKLSDHEKKQLFGNKKISHRLLVLVGGVMFNIVGAYVLFFFMLLGGTNVFLNPSTIELLSSEELNTKKLLLVNVKEGSPIENSGLKVGHEIVSVSILKDKVVTELKKPEINGKNLPEFIQANVDSEFSFKYVDDKGVTGEVKLIPKAGLVEGRKVLGASFADQMYKEYLVGSAVVDAAKLTIGNLIFIFVSLYQLVVDLFLGETSVGDNLAGPIGLAVLTTKVSERGLDDILSFAAMLSLSLAAFNILPIPALDGGRIVFVLLEAVRKKKIRADIEQMFHGFGFLLLIMLMLFVSYFDIVKAIAL
jgi:regulator of sigma E protease